MSVEFRYRWPNTMSTRAHFWFRLLALTAILVAQFGPRLWNGAASAAGVATASTAGVAGIVADRTP